MKARIVLTYFFSLSLITVLSSQTTLEEYNYLTKGYKIQIESGLDMKKGYSFEDYGQWGKSYSSFSRTAEFKGLIREGETYPCAILMILKRSDTGYKAYHCIPHPNSSTGIIDQSFRDLSTLLKNTNEVAIQGYLWGVMQFSSYLATGSPKPKSLEEEYNSKKKKFSGAFGGGKNNGN